MSSLNLFPGQESVAITLVETHRQLVVSEINILHAKIKEAGRTTLNDFFRTGELLADQKARVNAEMGPGHWLSWLKANVKLTDRTASTYMRYFENKELLKSEGVSDLLGAQRLLTKPKPKKVEPPTAADGHLEHQDLGFMQEVARVEVLEPEDEEMIQERLAPLLVGVSKTPVREARRDRRIK
jgi:Protein of unknown function (DUF3102)